MHITAICPGCGQQYQVSPTLRGQPMRCPLRSCGTIFTVGGEAPPPPPPPPVPSKTQHFGSVGDMVPILSAEVAVPPKPEPARSQTVHVSEMVPLIQAEAAAPPPAPSKPADAPAWQSAPPPRRSTNGESPPRTKPTPPPKRSESSEPTPVLDELPEIEEPPETVETLDALVPVELPPGQWEPPPVRRGAEAAVIETCDTATHNPEDHTVVSTKTRRARWLTAGILLTMFVVLGAGGAVAWFVLRDTEDKLWKQAQDDYKSGNYTAAAQDSQNLYDKFPTGGRRAEYAFFKQLCDLRAQLRTAPTPVAALDSLLTFVNEHKNDEPYFQQYGGDLSEASAKVLTDFTSNPPIDETTPDALAKADRLLAALRETLGDKGIKTDDAERLAQALPGIRNKHADWVHRAEVVKVVEELAKTPSADALRGAKRLLKKEEARLPGISQAPEVTHLLDKMVDARLDSVVYKGDEPQPQPGPREVVQPCILVAPKVQGAGLPNAPDGKVVLALARGVLYVLQQSDGQVVWAMPVGIDTTILPVRVPAAGLAPELILVVSADTETLSALYPQEGKEAWHYRLNSPCAGRPVVIEQRAYVPTVDGQVHEIELHGGQLLGRYQLGQRLSRGGVREGKTPRLYFPANDSCVYVLNVAQHKCEAILYTEHPAESLCGEPLIVGSKDDPDKASGWLVLTQKQPLDDVQLRVFELPVQPRQTGELTLTPPPRLPGWTWFPPRYDGEKLAVLSDAGVLGLFGIHQERTRDAALFPFLPGSAALNLDPFLPPHAKMRGQAEVVQVQGDDLWVLTHGLLQRLQLVWDGEKGRQLVPVWKEPPSLGEPLHASQVESDRLNGRGTLFLTTQSLGYRTCLATAVDDETGLVYWQRQLGLVCQGEPLLLKADDGPPLVLALDHGGGLFAFDPTHFDPQITDEWRGGGKLVAQPLPHNPRIPPRLLRGLDDESAFEIACPGDGQELVIRQVRTGDKRQVQVVHERRVKLAAPLAGTPAFSGAILVLPLADGTLYRLPWREDEKETEPGEDWRARLVAADVPGHVVALGGDRYLCTDGSRGLTVYHIVDKMWALLPQGGNPLELKDRILAAPLVLPLVKAMPALGGLGVWTIPLAPPVPPGPLQVCVADSGGVVTLLTVGGDGSLNVKRQWALKGRITAGPFVRRQGGALRLGCVVELRKGDQRLVWIDPDEKDPCWEYRSSGREIVGQPEMVEELLVVAEESGRYVALDPRTGQPLGPGYVLKGSIAPAAAPVAFGAGRLFAPLSDGTVLMLSLKQLQ